MARNLDTEISLRTLEAEIEMLKAQRPELIKKRDAAQRALNHNDEQQEAVQRKIIAILRGNQ